MENITEETTASRVVVTGGGNGLGRAIAWELARQGTQIVVCEQDIAAGQSTAAAIRQAGFLATFIPMDVTNEASVQQGFSEIAAHFGWISGLVNNVGHYVELGLEEMNLAEWQAELQTNLSSVFLCTKLALPLLRQAPAPKVIVNISSNLGSIAEPLAPAYCAAKAAVNMLTKCLALAYAGEQIRVVAVAPGPIGRSELETEPPDADEQEFSRFNPLGRFATPEEVARLVAYIASPAAAYMTGSVVALDGGETANPVSWSVLKRVKETGQV